MAVREILTVEHPVLRRKCPRIRQLDAGLHRLIDDMIDTMREANGVGLAAPQVGVPVRLFVVETPEDLEETHRGVVRSLSPGDHQEIRAVLSG